MMIPLRVLFLAGLTILAAMLSAGGDAREDIGMPTPMTAVDRAQALSVMTYNVNGLPWPIALGRDAALRRIAGRLAEMRRAGRQPHIVLMQEAFIPEAGDIARLAGYRHVALGPDVAMRSAIAPTAGDRAFLADARWDRGERTARQLGSGLIILSDYPMVRVERMAFPDFACAGFDCLANKGALLVRLRVPGLPGVVSVANTHLNARKASGVSTERSQRAFRRQSALLAQFLSERVPQGETLLIGGDMNIGKDADRARAFFGAFADAGLNFVSEREGGLRRALLAPPSAGSRAQDDLLFADRKRKDWLFARTAAGAPMPVAEAHVPFGSEPEGEPLSDHVGYVIDYAPTLGRRG